MFQFCKSIQTHYLEIQTCSNEVETIPKTSISSKPKLIKTKPKNMWELSAMGQRKKVKTKWKEKK